MSEVETRIAITLQQIARSLVTVGQNVDRSCWEIWGPPLLSIAITALGWWVVVRSNQKNNRDLLQLQAKELGRNRILDALGEYLEYLREIELPLMVMLREQAVKHQGPIPIFDDFSTQSKSVLDCAAVRDTITSLTLFDARATRWIGALHLDSWIFDSDSHVSQQATPLESAHEAIMADQVEYYKDLLSKTDEGEDAALAFLLRDRSAASVKEIQGQRKLVNAMRVALGAPAFLRTGGTAKKKPTP
jgi:hypothetical protein